jgi:hypothetical protein
MLARICTIALLLAGVVGCASTAPPPDDRGIFQRRNEGYSLLYQLMKDEGKVGGILILKSTDASLEKLVREIANTCDTARKQMDEFARSDTSIHLDVPNLPYVEQRSRDLESDDETKDLLFSGGDQFAVDLTFTQCEAMNYARELSRALAEKEQDPARKKFFTDLAKQCGDYHEQLMKMLAFHASH